MYTTGGLSDKAYLAGRSSGPRAQPMDMGKSRCPRGCVSSAYIKQRLDSSRVLCRLEARLAYDLAARSRTLSGGHTMVNCRLCDDSSADAVVVGYRWMLMVTAKSWGPSAPFDMRLTLAPSRKVASSRCSCLSAATIISIMSTKAKLTLAATSLGAIGIIIFVHHGQKVEKAVSRSIFPSTFLVLNCRTGNARRRHSRHGAATHKEGASTRLRHASRAGKGIPQAANCIRRPESEMIPSHPPLFAIRSNLHSKRSHLLLLHAYLLTRTYSPVPHLGC